MGGGRIAVHVDAISEKTFAPKNTRLGQEGLGFLRINSTNKRLEEFLGDDDPLVPGDWLEIETDSDKVSKPNIWGLQLQDGRLIGFDESGKAARTKLKYMKRLLRGTDTREPEDVNSAIAPHIKKAKSVRERFSLENLLPHTSCNSANAALSMHARDWNKSLTTIHDVGQANFCTIKPASNSDVMLFFDVGEPIWTHLHTLPRNFSQIAKSSSIVVLSHWDSDHYAYGLQNASFHNCIWIAPAQRSVGPNAYRLANILCEAGNLTLVGPGRSSRHRRGLRIIRCNGRNINGSGLALHIKAFNRDLLLTGDADYNNIPGIHAMRLHGIQIPHHGGPLSKRSVVPPARSTNAKAIASCGLPNRYDHPNLETLRLHSAASWHSELTASFAGRPRGDRVL